MKDSGAKEYAVLNGTVVLPDRLLEDGMVRWKGSSIVSVGKRRRPPKSVEQIDANGGYISPGFIDIHVSCQELSDPFSVGNFAHRQMHIDKHWSHWSQDNQRGSVVFLSLRFFG